MKIYNHMHPLAFAASPAVDPSLPVLVQQRSSAVFCARRKFFLDLIGYNRFTLQITGRRLTIGASIKEIHKINLRYRGSVDGVGWRPICAPVVLR